MFTNRRRLPDSSVRRAPNPGNCDSRSAISVAIVPALVCTVSCSLVSLRNGVGIRTLTGIKSLLCGHGGQKLLRAERGIERIEVRLNVSWASKLACDSLL